MMSDFDEKPFNYLAFIAKFRDGIAQDLANSNYDDMLIYKQLVGRRMGIDDLIVAINQELEKRKQKFK